MSKKPLAEQVIVVTGASTGVGRAVARAAGKRGASVVCAARNAEALDGAVREIEGYGAEPLAVPFDAASQDDCNVVVERAVDRFGHIDSFVRSHVVAVFGEIEKLTADELRRVRRFPAIRARAAGSASSPGRGRSGRRSGSIRGWPRCWRSSESGCRPRWLASPNTTATRGRLRRAARIG